MLDSRGQPTVEVEVHCGGAMGRAIVPSGASTGKHEALELRDGDPHDYGGKGVRKAVANVRQILAPAHRRHAGVRAGSDRPQAVRARRHARQVAARRQRHPRRLAGLRPRGGGVARQQPLWQYLDRAGTARMPLPMVNLISGGLHAGRNLDLQDFLFLPIGARSYSEALHMTVRVYRALSVTLQEHGYEGVLVGDEGGFGPKLG